MELVLNKVVEIKGYGLDPYNRLLGVLFLKEKNINLEMIKAGFAQVSQGGMPKGFDSIPYLKAEKEAKDTNSGIWRLGDDGRSPRKQNSARD